MSKYVKELVTGELKRRFEGIHDAMVVNVVGLDANATWRLRGDLESKAIRLMVVKNSLAARAAAGTPLAPMFDGLDGTAAVCWGSEDVVSLAKEVARLAEDKQYAAFAIRGGVMDGEKLSPKEVMEVSKWPSREEQLGLLVGQILGPGATLAAQLLGPGGALASQIAEKAKGEGEDEVDGVP
ncbi:MAG: 50S ribosomal protein L10 [Pirellulales bacterium]|nr:50S ribosomal protein L10 [Pirellulales bacterium]